MLNRRAHREKCPRVVQICRRGALNRWRAVQFCSRAVYFARADGVARGAMFWIARALLYSARALFIFEKRLVKTLARCVTEVDPGCKEVQAWFNFDAGAPKLEKPCLKTDAT